VRFRPCIDLHDGKVKQIVGATLDDRHDDALVTNFEAVRPASYCAGMYRRDGLEGGHVIMLGPGNDAAAESALAADPGRLQVGGGIRPDNARLWLDRGAAKLIVTSYVFVRGRFREERLRELVGLVGRTRLVLDLSCRRLDRDYVVVADRWRTVTDLVIERDSLARLAEFCAEFLIHAVDVEGRQAGIDRPLVARLAAGTPIPTTYAGGIGTLEDLDDIEELGHGKLDFTVGSALDIFGGTGLKYHDLVEFDRARR